MTTFAHWLFGMVREIIQDRISAASGWVTDLISRHPTVGIVTSIGGFMTSLASVIQFASIVIGLIGAMFGCAAGYYTYRVQKRKFENLNKEKPE